MSAQQQYIDAYTTLYINVTLRGKSINNYRKEKTIYDSYRKDNASKPEFLKTITQKAKNDADAANLPPAKPSQPTQKETEDYVKAASQLFYQKLKISENGKKPVTTDQLRMAVPLQYEAYLIFRDKYKTYPQLLDNLTKDAIMGADNEYKMRSNQTLSSKTSNPLLVLKQAILKNYRFKLDKKVMKNNVLDERINESDSSVIFLKQQVNPEDIKKVDENSLYEFLVIVVRNYINPIKNNPNKSALKMMYDELIDEYIKNNTFLTGKRQQIENDANNSDYVISEGFRISEGFKHIGVY